MITSPQFQPGDIVTIQSEDFIRLHGQGQRSGLDHFKFKYYHVPPEYIFTEGMFEHCDKSFVVSRIIMIDKNHWVYRLKHRDTGELIGFTFLEGLFKESPVSSESIHYLKTESIKKVKSKMTAQEFQEELL